MWVVEAGVTHLQMGGQVIHFFYEVIVGENDHFVL